MIILSRMLDLRVPRSVEEQCGPPGGQEYLCTDACLAILKRTWDACTDGVGTGDDMFDMYSDKIDACDDRSQDDACGKTAGEFLQWVSSNCCDGAPRSLAPPHCQDWGANGR